MLLHLGPGISAKASTSPAPGTGTTNKDKNDKQRNPAWTFGGISHAYIVATTLPHYKPRSLGYFFACAKDPGCRCATPKIDGEAAEWSAYRVWCRSPIPTCCTVWSTEKSQAARRYRLKRPTLPPCLKITTSDNWSNHEPANANGVPPAETRAPARWVANRTGVPRAQRLPGGRVDRVRRY